MAPGPFIMRVALAATWMAVAGCDALEQADKPGSYGNLAFTTDTGALATDFRNPVAVGAMLDIQVKAVRGGAVELTAVSFSPPETFEVVRFAGDVVTVRALERGHGSLEVTAEGSEGAVNDALELSAEAAAEVSLSHRCNFLNFKTAQYGVGAAPTLSYGLRSRLSLNLLGYGFAPLSIAPQGVIEVDEARGEPGTLRFTPATSAGAVTVRSSVDDEFVDFRFVDPAAIDAVKVAGVRAISLDAPNPTRKVWPMFDGGRVCRAGVVPTVTNTSSTHCSVEVTGAPGDEHATLTFTPRSVGSCQFTLTIPGTNVSETFEFQITDHD